MKTIKERAKVFAQEEKYIDCIGCDSCSKCKEYNTYVDIATEQKAIDIENVRKWVNDNKQPVLASETDDTVVGYCISVEEFIEWLKSTEE